MKMITATTILLASGFSLVMEMQTPSHAADVDVFAAWQDCTHHRKPVTAFPSGWEPGFEQCTAVQSAWNAMEPTRREAAAQEKSKLELDRIGNAIK